MKKQKKPTRCYKAYEPAPPDILNTEDERAQSLFKAYRAGSPGATGH